MYSKQSVIGVGWWLIGVLAAQAGSFSTGPTGPIAPTSTPTVVTTPAPEPPRFRIFSSFANTPDQQGIASQLDSMSRHPGSDLAGVLDILSRLPSDQVGAALNQLLPKSHDADTSAAIDAARRQIALVASFLEDSLTDDAGPWSVWTAGIHGSADGRQGDSSSHTAGGAGGADYRFGRNIRFGFAFGYTRTDVTQPGSASRGRVNAFNYGSYATWRFAQGYVEAIFNMAEDSYEDQRQILIGQLERFANSRHDGRSGSGYLGAGYDLTIAGLRLRPTAAFEYGRFHQQSFTEDGAGSLNMIIDDRTDDALQSRLGVRTDYEFNVVAVTVTPRASVNWGHQFNTDPRALQASFAQGGTTPFILHGPPGTADGLETSAGFSAKFLGVNLFADYLLTITGSSGMGHSFQVGLWTKF